MSVQMFGIIYTGQDAPALKDLARSPLRPCRLPDATVR